MPFGPAMEQAILAVGVVQGELPNILDAAIMDAAENLRDGVREAWPVWKGPRPAGKPHSRTLWKIERAAILQISIVNTASYASHVHATPKFGGPPGLGDRLLEAGITAIENDPLDFVSDRIASLLGIPVAEVQAGAA